jgi:hypothetical protein
MNKYQRQMDKNSRNNKITIINATIFGALYCAKEMRLEDIIDHPFLSSLSIASTIFVSIMCTQLTRFFAGFRITNAILMIANIGLLNRIYNIPH